MLGVFGVLSLVVSTSAIDCLSRLVSTMTCYVSSGTLNATHWSGSWHKQLVVRVHNIVGIPLVVL